MIYLLSTLFKAACSAKDISDRDYWEKKYKSLCFLLFHLHTFEFFQCLSSFFFLIYLISLFLAALGLCCCMRAFSSCGERGLLFVVVCGLLIAVASLAAEHGL